MSDRACSRREAAAVRNTARVAAGRALLMVGAVSTAFSGLGAAHAQTLPSTYGTPNPGYNLVTSNFGQNVDTSSTGPLGLQIQSIAGDPFKSGDQKAADIKAAVDQSTTSNGATQCAQQLDDVAGGLALTSDILAVGGDVAEALGAAGTSAAEIPGIVIQIAGDGFGIAADGVALAQTKLPNCSAEFTGTVLADANIAASQGISAFNGHINLGNADGVTYQGGIALGGGSLSGAGTLGHEATTGAASAIAIGNDAVGSSDNSTALGDAAGASATGATAIGSQAQASAPNAFAAGLGANASGSGSVSLGANSTSDGQSAVAIGDGASASGDGATAIGASASALGNSTALGNGASTQGDGATALGSSSLAFAGGTAVGDSAFAGGAQSTALGKGATTLGDGATALGASSIASNGGTAVGESASARGAQSTALGSSSQASGADSAAVGDAALATGANSTALGPSSSAIAEESVAIGQGSVADVANTVSVGNSSLQRRITNVAAGTSSTDAVNVSQLQGLKASTDAQFAITNLNVANNTTNITQLTNGTAGPFQVNNTNNAASPQATGPNSLAAGPGSTATASNALALGITATAVAKESTVIGNAASATAQDTTVIGYSASATGINSVVLGANSTDDGQSDVVSVGSPDSTRRIINVSDGTGMHDAVNVEQLLGASATTLGLANSYTDLRFGQAMTALRGVQRDANAATASAMAVAAIPQTFEGGKSIIGVGTGTWDGQQAIAIGGSTASADGRFIFKLGATLNTRGQAGGAAGAGISF